MNYNQYYLDQAGGQYSVFHGAARQKGYGLGGMFRSMYKYILPLFKSHALPVLKKGAQLIGSEAIKAASNIANDAIRGENIGRAFKQHSANAVNTISNEAQTKLQSGSGRKRKHSKDSRRSHSKKPPKKARRVVDIFG